MPIAQKKVAVIGAGPSGITALKNLLDRGITAVAFDRNHDIGGNWIYSEAESHSSVFETTHIISSRSLSEYEDFPFDDFDTGVADYPSHDELRRYFQAYGKKFDLYPHIRFGTLVQHCERRGPEEWVITFEQDGARIQETFTDLVVCNGHHWKPRVPEYAKDFAGQFLHSHQFKKAEPFRGKRVLVIGGGNSACDVAVETSRVSQKTAISMRRGYRIVPKFVFGKPADIVAQRFAWLPVKWRSKLNALLLNVLIGKNEAYGLPPVDHAFGATHPTINSELLYTIRHGKVHPYPDIQKIEGHTVYFTDGRSDDYDVIIACTGFILAHPFFDPTFLDYSEGEVPLYLKMLHPEYRNLYFVGMFQPLGCIWPGAELQARIMAAEIAGTWRRPDNIVQLIEKEVQQPHYRQVNSPRHTITVDYHLFRKELLRAWKKHQKRLAV